MEKKQDVWSHMSSPSYPLLLMTTSKSNLHLMDEASRVVGVALNAPRTPATGGSEEKDFKNMCCTFKT